MPRLAGLNKSTVDRSSGMDVTDGFRPKWYSFGGLSEDTVPHPYAVLVESFKISPVRGKEIDWRSLGIARPGIFGISGYQLPLVVERAI